MSIKNLFFGVIFGITAVFFAISFIWVIEVTRTIQGTLLTLDNLNILFYPLMALILTLVILVSIIIVRIIEETFDS